MTTQLWIYYALSVLVLTASPGPSSLLCMTKGVTAGWRASAATALGSLSAITIIMTLSFTGLGVVIASSELVFNLIKWAGAAYLIYLGVSCLMSKQESYVRPDGQTSSDSKSHFIGGFVVLELSWLLFYGYLGARSSNWLLAKGRAKVFNRLTGGVFIGAGALLSSTSRG